jgi:hypothetical protein
MNGRRSGARAANHRRLLADEPERTRVPVARQGTRIVDSDIVIILTLASVLSLTADHLA